MVLTITRQAKLPCCRAAKSSDLFKSGTIWLKGGHMARPGQVKPRQARLGQRAAKRPTARKIWQMRLAERVLYIPMQFARLVCFLLGSLPQWCESLSE